MAAARAGARVEVISALADDAKARLRAEGIQVRNLKRRGEPHAISVSLSTHRDRAFVTFDGVNRQLEERLLARFEAALPRARHLHLAFGPRSLGAWVRLLERCRAWGITTSWDFGWHDALPERRGFLGLLRMLDWVFVNEREACHYAGVRTLPRACQRWPKLALRTVIKQGAAGALALAADGMRHVAAPRVRVVDTTGAGDAFNGGFLAALVRGEPIEACLAAGVWLGSESVRAAGGLDGLPPRAEARPHTPRSRR